MMDRFYEDIIKKFYTFLDEEDRRIKLEHDYELLREQQTELKKQSDDPDDKEFA
jgi:hypothetical protein